MKKFEKLYKILMEEVSSSSKKKYVFNEQQFEDAWIKTWNSDERKQLQKFFKKGAMPVSKIKGIFKDLCKAVSEGKNEQAYKIWTKVGTSGYLNRLMWAQGWDCGIPKNFGDKTVKKITFSPHKGEGLFKQSVIKESLDDSELREVVAATVEKVSLPEGLDKKQVTDDICDLLYGKDFADYLDLEQGVLDYIEKTYGTEEDYNDEHWVEHKLGIESKKVNKRRKIIKEDVDVDYIIEYWRDQDVDEIKYPDEKLKEFIDEFFIDENGEYRVVDLEDTNDGEYGTPEYAPEFEWDQLVFVYLNPDNTVTVESDEGREDFEDWMEAKNYLIEQMDSTFDNGDDEEDDIEDGEDDIEEQSVIKEEISDGAFDQAITRAVYTFGVPDDVDEMDLIGEIEWNLNASDYNSEWEVEEAVTKYLEKRFGH